MVDKDDDPALINNNNPTSSGSETKGWSFFPSFFGSASNAKEAAVPNSGNEVAKEAAVPNKGNEVAKEAGVPNSGNEVAKEAAVPNSGNEVAKEADNAKKNDDLDEKLPPNLNTFQIGDDLPRILELNEEITSHYLWRIRQNSLRNKSKPFPSSSSSSAPSSSSSLSSSLSALSSSLSAPLASALSAPLSSSSSSSSSPSSSSSSYLSLSNVENAAGTVGKYLGEGIATAVEGISTGAQALGNSLIDETTTQQTINHKKLMDAILKKKKLILQTLKNLKEKETPSTGNDNAYKTSTTRKILETVRKLRLKLQELPDPRRSDQTRKLPSSSSSSSLPSSSSSSSSLSSAIEEGAESVESKGVYDEVHDEDDKDDAYKKSMKGKILETVRNVRIKLQEARRSDQTRKLSPLAAGSESSSSSSSSSIEEMAESVGSTGASKSALLAAEERMKSVVSKNSSRVREKLQELIQALKMRSEKTRKLPSSSSSSSSSSSFTRKSQASLAKERFILLDNMGNVTSKLQKLITTLKKQPSPPSSD